MILTIRIPTHSDEMREVPIRVREANTAKEPTTGFEASMIAHLERLGYQVIAPGASPAQQAA